MAEKPAAATAQQTRDQEFVARLLKLEDVTGINARKLAREMFPDAIIPEPPAAAAVAVDEIVRPVKTELDTLRTDLAKALERIAAKEQADKDLASENDMRVKIEKASQTFGLTDSGKTKMIERMQTTGNTADADAAAAWVVSQMPKPEPTNAPSWLPENSNLFGTQQKDEKWESLHLDPRKYLDNELREFAKNPDKYTNETFGNA